MRIALDIRSSLVLLLIGRPWGRKSPSEFEISPPLSFPFFQHSGSPPLQTKKITSVDSIPPFGIHPFFSTLVYGLLLNPSRPAFPGGEGMPFEQVANSYLFQSLPFIFPRLFTTLSDRLIVTISAAPFLTCFFPLFMPSLLNVVPHFFFFPPFYELVPLGKLLRLNLRQASASHPLSAPTILSPRRMLSLWLFLSSLPPAMSCSFHLLGRKLIPFR